MKIKVEEGNQQALLSQGRHQVEITDVAEGRNEHKDVPFFACRFENEEGYITSRFYLSESEMAAIVSLFEAIGTKFKPGQELNTDLLLHQQLGCQ